MDESGYEEFVAEIRRFLDQAHNHMKFGLALLKLSDALQEVEEARRKIMEDDTTT